jgi:CRISPR-associated protein Cas2
MWGLGKLYLVAWDIADRKRLGRVHRRVRRHALDGQKSVYECRLTGAEREQLLRDVAALIDPEEDSFLVFPLDPRSAHEYVGRPAPLWSRLLDYFG